MDFIDPAAPKTSEYIHEARNQSQKERIAPYRPSINAKLAKLFVSTIPNEIEKPAAAIVDWSFLDQDDGQPGEPADWVKKQIKQIEKWGEDDDLHKEMLEDIKQRHRWTRKIPPPNIPKRHDPNEKPFNPGDVLGYADSDI